MFFIAAVSGRVNGILQFVTVLLIFVFVLAITWVCTRLFAGYQQKVNHTKHIRVIESFRISGNKLIQIVAIGKAYFAIGVGKEEITLLSKLSEDELPILPEAGKELPTLQEDFKDILDKLKGKMTGKREK
ncbi:hypothetical protein FACS1894111_02530 [Clostridia bacterium]|nr:hypothetical protein FACS1894111_02530 [Clostridia bacterium]